MMGMSDAKSLNALKDYSSLETCYLNYCNMTKESRGLAKGLVMSLHVVRLERSATILSIERGWLPARGVADDQMSLPMDPTSPTSSYINNDLLSRLPSQATTVCYT